MRNFIIVLVAAIVIQVCTSATVEDAENKLKELRDLANKKIREAFQEHTQMSNEVDNTARSTKEHGLNDINKKTDKFLAKLKVDKALGYLCRGSRDNIYGHLQNVHSDELIKCVDETGAESVNVLSTQRIGLVEYIWNAIYAEEKHIINCGNDSDCLGNAIASITDKIYEVEKVINDEIHISKHNKEVQLQAIKACASRNVANAENALSSVPTCTF